MSDQINTAQDVVKQIEVLGGGLIQSRMEVEWAKENFCRFVVRRNAAFVKINALPDEEKEGLVGKRLEAWAHDDDGYVNDLETVQNSVAGCQKDLNAIREGFIRIWNIAAKSLDEALKKLAIAEQRLVVAEQRTKEHALHNAEVRETVWRITDGKCFYCDVDLLRCIGDEPDRSRCFHVDHLVPKSSGGPDHLSNYVPACERCNISKGAKSYVEFVACRKAQQPLLTVIEGGVTAVGGAAS